MLYWKVPESASVKFVKSSSFLHLTDSAATIAVRSLYKPLMTLDSTKSNAQRIDVYVLNIRVLPKVLDTLPQIPYFTSHNDNKQF